MPPQRCPPQFVVSGSPPSDFLLDLKLPQGRDHMGDRLLRSGRNTDGLGPCRAQSDCAADRERQATPAAFRAARTRAGVIGAVRIRTPVASKKAFATAAGAATVTGSPTPAAKGVFAYVSHWTTIGVT